MDELIFAGNKYISSKRAGKLTGYTTDYVGQMCRGGKMDCRLVGRNWYINEAAIKAQKKSFKKEQLGENKKEIEYSKIELEPIYYSDDERTNNIEIDKKAVKAIKEEEPAEEPKENLIPVLSMVESPMVDLRTSSKEVIKRPLREVREPARREVTLAQRSPVKLPMARLAAFMLILAGLLFVVGTLTLEKTVRYASSDKELSTKYQLANVVDLFSF